MTPLERVKRALAGSNTAHPVGFWRHFPGASYGAAAVEAHLRHQETYNLDFVKVMNDNLWVHKTSVGSIGDLAGIERLRGNEKHFERQLDLIVKLRARLGRDIPLVATLVNPLWVLRRAVAPPASYPGPNWTARLDGPSRLVREWARKDPHAIRDVLAAYAASLRSFARQCLRAGADGIFLTARFDWLEPTAKHRGRYAAIAKSSDLEVLKGASEGWFNMVHACGDVVDLRALRSYAAAALNWADRSVGPSIREGKRSVRTVLCGGVNELTLAVLPPEKIEAQVADAIQQAGRRALMITPGCAYDPRTPRANLRAIVRAAREGGS